MAGEKGTGRINSKQKKCVEKLHNIFIHFE